MSENRSIARIQSVGRVAMWVVLAVMFAAAVLAVWIAVTNWRAIGV